MKVSIIIPCFNAIDKIGRCLSSLRTIDMIQDDYEVLFIDDFSTDGTFILLQKECLTKKNWYVEQLEINSGSPSRPRNRGMHIAKGEYVFFLDCDDEIFSDTIRLHYNHAIKTSADVVRGYLIVNDGNSINNMNQLKDWHNNLDRKNRISMIISQQSTVVPSLIRLSLIRDNNILWPEDIRMGEDSVFLASVLSKAKRIEYIDHQTFIYNKQPAFTASTTQSYGAKELRDHLNVWRKVHNILLREDLNYIELRLRVGLQTALLMLIFRNRHDIDEILFSQFSDFICEHFDIVATFNYSDRLKGIIFSIHSRNYLIFKQLCRPRLLIAGYDLKFISLAIPILEKYFDIRLDTWTGHDSHDEKKSRELLDWAELIWCEWLLGNAVWYSANKRLDQRLVVRMHRFELSRNFGEKVKFRMVDAVVVVSVLFFEKFLERFPNFSRAKLRLVPNFIKTFRTDRIFNGDCLFTLAMIGIIPSRKGLHRALEILAKLRSSDKRFRLEIFGELPDNIPWIKSDRAETNYFQKCYKFIQVNDLSNHVTFNGHCNLESALKDKNVGFVLSLSDSTNDFPGPESFHLAIADGFGAGSVSLILKWSGAEYIWPQEFILSTPDKIVSRILSFCNNKNDFIQASERGRLFIEENYCMDNFVQRVVNLYQELM